MSTPAFDVCVIGAGPAGAIAALELARFGFRVHLLHRPRQGQHWPETVPQQLSLLLEKLGLGHALAAAIRVSVSEKWLLWRGEERVRIVQPGGVIIDRDRLEAGLRACAAQLGVTVTTATAGRAIRLSDGTWHVPIGDAGKVHARFVVIASGRECLRRETPPERAETMVACYGTASRSPVRPGTMVVGSVSDHWYWGAALADSSFHITAFKRTRGLARKVSPEALLKQALRSIGSSSDVSFIRATDATSRRKKIAAGDGWIQIGDAVLAIDPLTSNGLYLAALSSVQAARVINTIMRRPDDAAGALAFFASAQAEIADHCASYSEAFYRSGMRGGTGGGAAHPAAGNHASNSHDWILSPTIRLEPVPVLSGDFVTQALGLRRSKKRSLACVEGIPVANLLEPLQAGRTLEEAKGEWSSLSAAGCDQFARLLVEEGIVVRQART
jgi:flavin-dependent dehydrogenase